MYTYIYMHIPAGLCNGPIIWPFDLDPITYLYMHVEHVSETIHNAMSMYPHKDMHICHGYNNLLKVSDRAVQTESSALN